MLDGRARSGPALSDDAGAADRAPADRALALSVARHKAMFFPEKDAAGGRIDDEAAVAGGLQDDCATGPTRIQRWRASQSG